MSFSSTKRCMFYFKSALFTQKRGTFHLEKGHFWGVGFFFGGGGGKCPPPPPVPPPLGGISKINIRHRDLRAVNHYACNADTVEHAITRLYNDAQTNIP